MKCKIETSNGIMFLKGIDGDKRLEIADYIELHDSSLLISCGTIGNCWLNSILLVPYS